MSDTDITPNQVDEAHDEMPFRLSDITLKNSVADLHPALKGVGLKIDNILWPLDSVLWNRMHFQIQK